MPTRKMNPERWRTLRLKRSFDFVYAHVVHPGEREPSWPLRRRSWLRVLRAAMFSSDFVRANTAADARSSLP